MSTYYPAPSGLYTNMTATANTFLARDAGAVVIGTRQAPAGAKLAVMGGAMGIGTTAPTAAQDGRAIGLHVAQTAMANDAYMSSPAYGSPRWASNGSPPTLGAEVRVHRPAGVGSRSASLGMHHACFLTGFKSWADDSDMNDGCRVYRTGGDQRPWTLETRGHREDANSCWARCIDWGTPSALADAGETGGAGGTGGTGGTGAGPDLGGPGSVLR